jgi:hypothetical protein
MLHHVALAQRNWLLPTINQRWAHSLCPKVLRHGSLSQT